MSVTFQESNKLSVTKKRLEKQEIHTHLNTCLLFAL